MKRGQFLALVVILAGPLTPFAQSNAWKRSIAANHEDVGRVQPIPSL
jgi:hypothetical protein